MKDVLVSVVVSTYRRDDALYNAILSLVNQTYKNIEIIVVDDNADLYWNERVAIIIEKIQKKSVNVIQHIVNKVNLGSAATRNVAIDLAKGEYITFLDDDDVYLPQKVEMQLADFLISGADYGLTDLYLYDESDGIIDRRIRSYMKSMAVDDLMRYHLLYHMTGTDTLMFRTEYLKKIGGFPNINVGDEFYLMREAILGRGKCVYSPHCYVKAYIHTGENGGLSSGQSKINGENALYAEKVKSFSYLNSKEIRYVKTRHYLVIAFAELRRKAYIAFIENAIKAFFSSPNACMRILKQHK